ncbi:MAG: peptidoglycan DD-metalloendopeptidase family protein [Oscillospiraceae bacterium]
MLGGNMVSNKTISNTSAEAAQSPAGKLYNGLYSFGEYIFSVILSFFSAVKSAFLDFMDRNEHRLAAAAKWFRKLGRKLIHPFSRHHKATKMSLAEIKKTREEHGFLKAFLETLAMFGRFVFGKHGIAYSLFNYALPIISMVMLFNIVSYANSMTYTLKLYVNDEFMGYVSSETVFTDAERIVQQRINYMDSNTEPVSFEATYQLENVENNYTMTKYQLADKLLISLGAEIERAYGMYIGNSFYGALVDKTPIENTLEELLDQYRTGARNETVAFENIITYEPGMYLSESIVDPESIISIITSKKSVAVTYTAVEGDSPLAIADKLDMSISEIAALNPGFSEDTEVFIGSTFLIQQEEPFLAVTVTRTEVYTEPTDYDVEYYDDSTKYQGSSVIVQDGEYGKDRITADVSYINGIEVRRKIISRTTIEAPIPKIVANGTKPPPPNASISTVEVGKMLWPVGGSGGLISELPYGYGGYYAHSGIDIAADYGTPIYAADNGTVILARWYGDYGNCVMIEHDNGIVTVYAHASYLHVYEGQRVTQGEAIADVGSTGRSTGNHLHFEVRINGVCMYPLNYLPEHAFASWCVRW